jgi:hypothetical protein
MPHIADLKVVRPTGNYGSSNGNKSGGLLPWIPWSTIDCLPAIY